jgi:predicted Zn-dependent peptidase
MVYNIPNQIDLSSFYIIYNGVVVNEDEGNYGISHLIEHLICKNLDDEFVELLEKNGITWNAYTTPNNIVFYIKGLDDYVYKFKDDFIKKILNFNIQPDQFEIEKRVVLEEYSDLFNRYNKNHFLNLYRKVLNNYNSVGKKENIENLTVVDCLNYYNKFYSKPSNIVYISKNYKQEDNITFNDHSNKKIFEFGNYNTILESPMISPNKSSIIYLSPIIYEDFDKIIFINYLLSGGLKSPLYRAIREKNSLAYYINCRIDRLDNNGIIIISTETSDTNIEKLDEVIVNVFKERNYLTKDKFETIKNFIKISLIKSNINLQDNEDKFILPQSWLIENTIDTITYEDIIETFDKHFDINKFYKSINKQEFLNF